jgi:hypothetical protein
VNVYPFGHLFRTQYVWRKYLDDSQPKMLLCENNVAPFFAELAGPEIKLSTFRYLRNRQFVFKIIRDIPRKLLGRKVTLVTGTLSGSHLIYALALYRVKEIIFVDNQVDLDVRVISPWDIHSKLSRLAYSILLGRKIVFYSIDGARVLGIPEKKNVHFSPPSDINYQYPLRSHDHDLIVLDFDLDDLDVDFEKSLANIRLFISQFKNPALKPHPTHEGIGALLMIRSTLHRSVPAETLAHNAVTCLYLESAASAAFTQRTNVFSLLVFQIREDEGMSNA